MEVKRGYKQTEIGVVPEEWEFEQIARLESRRLVKLGRGQVISRLDIERNPGDFPIYSSSVHNKGEFGRYGHFMFDEELITWSIDGGGNFFWRPKHKFSVTNVCGFMRVDSEHICYAFLAAVLQLLHSRKSFDYQSKAHPSVIRKEYAVPLPALAEQRAIAAALSDVDALLAGLDRLIAKKRDLKQAAMQQLLTAQTRLPGFSGEWEVKRLGEIANIKTGSRNNEDKIEDGEYPFFVRSEIVERINSYSHDCEAILVPGEGRIGDIFHYINGRFDVHQRVYAITQFRPTVSAKFVHLYMAMNFGAWAMQNTVKATVDSLRLPTFQTFEMLVPPTKVEQTAIATVLSDMDAELAALKARRDKTRDLKQAMMQELLTGKTRLVKPEAAHA